MVPWLVVFLFTILLFSENAAASCLPLRLSAPGLNVNFYGYDLRTRVGWNDDYFTGGYKNGGLKKTVENVVDINFSFPSTRSRVVVNGNIYGYPLTISNFSMELTGYFRADYTGTHTFTIVADDGVTLQFGNGVYCCDDVNGALGNTSFGINSLRGYGGNPPANPSTFSVQLQAGRYYPMKLIFFNWDGILQLDVSYVNPLGKKS
ncbi:CIC11C00000001727 [Sungouiella intermedia]|uniref:CIC11C00000001727 n=1 Tax=Sungouiella intermedia TaxID=45354 RepID=A0A1L0D4W5_9ASCO|nr:CIC11C00000001727 [[Candida] intermedia]